MTFSVQCHNCGMETLTEEGILYKVEQYASRPKHQGYEDYPTDDECDAYEARLRARNNHASSV